MTSKKSLPDPFGFTVRRTIKKNWFLGAAISVILLLYYSQIWSYISRYRYLLKTDALAARALKTDSYLYLFRSYEEFDTLSGMFIGLIAVLVAVVLSFFIFSFLMNKGSTNVYFSLGVSREKLFSSLYLSGIILMACGVFVPVAAVTAGNACFFGPSRELFFYAANVFLKIFISLSYTFTVFTLAQIVLGSGLEAVVMGAVCFASPLMMIYTAGNFASILVRGSPYILSTFNSQSIRLFGGEYIDTQMEIEKVSGKLFPTAFDYNLNYIPCVMRDQRDALGEYFSSRAFIAPVILLALIAVGAVICGILFKRRKNEKTGFMGMCTLIEGYCVVTVGSFLAAVVSEIVVNDTDTSYKNKCLAVVLTGIVIMAIGYTVVDLISVRSLKEYRKRFKNLIIELGVFCLIAAVFVTGFFGKFYKIPTADEVKSASVTVNRDALGDFDGNNPYGYGYTSDSYSENGLRIDASLSLTTETTIMTPGFTDKADIEKIISVNRKADKESTGKPDYHFGGGLSGEDTVPCIIRFEYELNNGKKVKRMYKAASIDSITELAELTETEHYRKTVSENLSPGSTSYEAFLQDDIWVNAYSPDYINATQVGALSTRAGKEKLLEVLNKDILDGTLPLNYISSSPLIGYLAFSHSLNGLPENGIPDDEEESYYTDVPMTEENFDYLNSAFAVFPVHENMKNTVEYIKENGLMKYFETGTVKVKSVTCFKYEDESKDSYRTIFSSFMLSGRIVFPDAEANMVYQVDEYGNEIEFSLKDRGYDIPANAKKITDAAEIENILSSVRLKYPEYCEGNFVLIQYENGVDVIGYVPSESM